MGRGEIKRNEEWEESHPELNRFWSGCHFRIFLSVICCQPPSSGTEVSCMNSDGETGFMSLHDDSVCITGWCWNNWRILQGFSWCEMSQKLILLWEFHCYHFSLWLMRNACETTYCSRKILFLNSFIKASKTKSLDWVFFCFCSGISGGQNLAWEQD